MLNFWLNFWIKFCDPADKILTLKKVPFYEELIFKHM